jgi:hypothetical protein
MDAASGPSYVQPRFRPTSRAVRLAVSAAAPFLASQTG